MSCKVLLPLSIISLFLYGYSSACSCMPMHPQEHYCNSDFVILARITRRIEANDTVTYKVRIRQEYKMTEKALVALKSGKLQTFAYSHVCGVPNLQLKETYVISGRISSLRAYVTLCDMIIPRKEITRRQKKGLKLMYKLGCTCKVRSCKFSRCPRRPDSCNWENDCHKDEGICLRNKRNQCAWRTTQSFRKCIRKEQEKTHHLTMIGVEGLLNKRKTIPPEPPLDLH